MPVKEEILALHKQMIEWRHDLHAHPETAFEEVRTSEIVANKLKAFGIEVHQGLAKTGVVGTLKVGNSPRNIALRADMDALDLQELNTFAHKSIYKGKMHACGHDGHTTMLLGAAKYLAETKKFDGTVYFIFQPAEENRAGARLMIKEGLFEKFPATSVYGMHNMPGLPAGQFGVRVGPMMASADFFEITVTGRGTHGAYPHRGIDPILVASQIVVALQSIVSRHLDPVDHAVVSVTQFNGGTTTNVIPDSVTLAGTCRALSLHVQDQLEEQIKKISQGIATTYGATAEVKYERRYCPTINTADETEIAAKVATAVVGEEHVNRQVKPSMGAEDFGWMLQEKPGCYIWIGAGEGPETCTIHNPHYDFNDRILPIGASYWAELVESQLAP